MSRKLGDYTRAAWHLVEPSQPYIPNWHLDAIFEHLMAVSRREIMNLIINIPPRFTKSLSVSVMWPTWTWTWEPESRWLFGSYGEDLAVRDALKSRRILTSEWYQKRWGNKVALRADQNLKARYENQKGGFRVSFGVAGATTGEGGDYIVIDDPMKAKNADSKAELYRVQTWWDETMTTRVNDPLRTVKVIIMQRLSEGDLTGHLLEKMRLGGQEWVHLCLPMRHETARGRYVTPIGWKDPRTEPNELLWPGRFPEQAVADWESSLGRRGTAGQLQQRPAPEGGLIYERQWWEDGRNRIDVDATRKVVARFLSVDTGLKEKDENDFSACTVWDMLPDYSIVPIDYWKQKVGMPALLSALESIAYQANRDDQLSGVVIEDRMSGTSAIQTMRQAAPEWLKDKIIGFYPHADKRYRAKQASLWCERDCVKLPFPSGSVPWLFDFEHDLFNYPSILHDDVVDQCPKSSCILSTSWRSAGTPEKHAGGPAHDSTQHPQITNRDQGKRYVVDTDSAGATRSRVV
ncbi:MAG: hypothetical protein ABIH46_08375 [Chloroflexota bacterium]